MGMFQGFLGSELLAAKPTQSFPPTPVRFSPPTRLANSLRFYFTSGAMVAKALQSRSWLLSASAPLGMQHTVLQVFPERKKSDPSSFAWEPFLGLCFVLFPFHLTWFSAILTFSWADSLLGPSDYCYRSLLKIKLISYDVMPNISMR